MPAALPSQVKYIVSTEACERFSFYGMLSILTLYLNRELKLSADEAKEIVHLFKMAVYFLPLAGAWLADRWIGRYQTILRLSLFYCLGHAALAIFEGNLTGIYAGLTLIAIGAGGIKPCVSAFVGDQFAPGQRDLFARVYGLFYWAINLGAMFAFALIPFLRDQAGYRWAFAVPGIFMGLATLVFWLGAPHYLKKSPGRARESREHSGAAEGAAHDSASPVVSPEQSKTGGHREVGTLRTLMRIGVVLLPVPVFWALYDQINTSWVLQGTRMQPFAVLGFKVDAERIQSVSALLVLIWVPILTFWAYPVAERLGLRPTPLRRMAVGMVFTALSFVICAWLEQRLNQGAPLSLTWQLLPYVVLELGEVLVSASGLEFAYAQAPATMKSVVMSFWLLTTSLGNLLVALVTNVNARFVHAQGVAEFLFYAGLMLVVAVVFALLARRYQATNQR